MQNKELYYKGIQRTVLVRIKAATGIDKRSADDLSEGTAGLFISGSRYETDMDFKFAI